MTTRTLKEEVGLLHDEVKTLCDRLLLTLSLVKVGNEERSEGELNQQRLALYEVIRTLNSLYTTQEEPHPAMEHFDD